MSREYADFVSAYHVLPPNFTYAEYCGLIVQLDRPRYQRAGESLLAGLYASLPNRLADVWFDALSRFSCDVDEMRWLTNAPRAEAEAEAKGKRGWR